VRADAQINKAVVSANAGDLDRVIDQGQRAADAFEPTGAYDFLFARALAECAQRLQPHQRPQVLKLAAEKAKKSLKHALTADSSYRLLAHLALSSGDTGGARAYAAEAIRIDPNYSPAHRLMGEAYLAEGDREQAAIEAKLSIELDPFSPGPVSLLKRAEGKATPQKLIARARKLEDAGKMKKARRQFLRALRRSSGPCPDCHHGLALIHEKTGLYEEAIAEWQAFIRDDPARAASEQMQARIEMLKQKSGGRQ
jgi:tetratricopeptide (TPR) repeat protein